MGNNLTTQSIEATAITLSSKSMGGGVFTATVGYLSSSGAAVLIGVLVTLMGFALSTYFNRRRDRREEREWKFKKSLLMAEELRNQEQHAANLRLIENEQTQ